MAERVRNRRALALYQDGTSCRIGELVKLFPKLNIAVVSVHTPTGKTKVLPLTLQIAVFIGAPNMRHFLSTLLDGVL
jgi:hypothetical protein